MGYGERGYPVLMQLKELDEHRNSLLRNQTPASAPAAAEGIGSRSAHDEGGGEKCCHWVCRKLAPPKAVPKAAFVADATGGFDPADHKYKARVPLALPVYFVMRCMPLGNVFSTWPTFGSVNGVVPGVVACDTPAGHAVRLMFRSPSRLSRAHGACACTRRCSRHFRWTRRSATCKTTGLRMPREATRSHGNLLPIHSLN